MRKIIILCLYLSVACLIAYNPASANYYFVINPSDPALTGIMGINFDDQALGQYTSLTIGNVTYTASLSPVAQNTDPSLYYYGPYFYISDNPTGGYPYNTSGRFLSTGNGYNPDTPGCDILTMAFANPTSAFGFSWGALDTIWTLTAYDSSNNLLASFDLTDRIGFGGVANDSGIADIARLVLTQYHPPWLSADSGDALFIDYPASAVPLPGSLLLLGSGLTGLGFLRRRLSLKR
jgi:hypothetical protein